MNIISLDKKFNIQMPQELYNGDDLRNQKVDIHITLLDGVEATVTDLGRAVRDCYAPYEFDYRQWAPKMHVYAHIKENTFEIDMDWQYEDLDYIIRVADQFKM